MLSGAKNSGSYRELRKYTKRWSKHTVSKRAKQNHLLRWYIHKINYKIFYDCVFIVDREYLLGHYRITYADGEKAYLKVKYGTNISCKYYDADLIDSGFSEVSYSTFPLRYKDGFAYETVFEDPHPDKTIKSVEYIPQK